MKKDKLSLNFLFSIIGNISVIGYNVLLLPIVLNKLGAESSGIIGFYSTVFSTLSFFDLGLGILANREISRRKDENSNEVRALIGTLETIYWFISIIIFIIFFFNSTYISNEWIKGSSFTNEELSYFIKLIAISIFFRWPISFYLNLNSGLQKLVKVNIFKVTIYVMLILSLYFMIIYLEYNIGEYMLILGISNSLLVGGYMLLFKYEFGFSRRIYFNVHLLKKHFKYALGSMIISSLTIFLLQLDKLYLSYTGDLSSFGIYTVIFSLSIGIVQLIYPITGAFFPKINELIILENKEMMLSKIELVSHILVIIGGVFLCVFISFDEEILNLWLGEYNEGNKEFLLKILIIASVLYGISQLGYLIESALGKVNRAIILFVILNILYVSLLVSFKNMYGVNGVAISFLIISIMYCLGNSFLIFDNLGKKECIKWFKLVLKNLVIIIIFILLIKKIKYDFKNKIFLFIEISLIFSVVLSVLVIVNRKIREVLIDKTKYYRKNVKRNKI